MNASGWLRVLDDSDKVLQLHFNKLKLKSKCNRGATVEDICSWIGEYGVITTKQAEALGIPRNALSRLVKENKLERIRNGVYGLYGDLFDDYAVLAAGNDIIFSYGTALYLHGLSLRVPDIIEVTVPQGYNARHLYRIMDNISIHYVKKEHFDVGRTMMRDFMGNLIPVYDRERCLCDIIRDKNKVEIEIFCDAVKEYFRKNDRDWRVLDRYGETFGIGDRIRTYAEVLQ